MKKSFILLSACVMLAGLSLASPAPSHETGFSVIENGSVLPELYNGSHSITDPAATKNRVALEGESESDMDTTVVPERKRTRTFKVAPVHGSTGKFLLTVGKDSRGFTITIFDKYGTEIYKESKILDGDFAKVYNFSKVKGEVAVVVSDYNGNESKVTF